MEKEKWLLLDDSVMDRQLMGLALGPYSEKIQLVLAGTVSETRELLQESDFSVCLLDFFLKRNMTSESLIAEIRSNWPGLPIVVVSSQTESSARLYKAGADCVIPKLADTASFGKSVLAAANQAKTLRQLRVPGVSLRQTYISEKARVAFRQAVKRECGNIIVVSPAGMGRTDLALALGERLRQRYRASHGDSLITVSCKELAERADAAASLLFGTLASENHAATPGLLHQARTAVVIIDDAHLLPQQVQETIKRAFERGYFELGTGERIRTARLRLIFTAQDGEEHRFIQGFLQRLVSFRIRIPTFAGMLNELPAVVAFWFRRAARQRRHRAMRMSRSFKYRLAETIRHTPTRVTMRSVVRTIEAAIENALDDNRLIVTDADLGEMELLFEDLPTSNPLDDDAEKLSIPIDDPVGIASWRELFTCISHSTLEDTVAQVRQMAIQYALARTDGNCSKAAELLGIARQSLYKEHLRELTLRETRKLGRGAKGVSFSHVADDSADS